MDIESVNNALKKTKKHYHHKRALNFETFTLHFYKYRTDKRQTNKTGIITDLFA